MIKNKDDYKRYLEADRIALGNPNKKISFFCVEEMDYIYNFLFYLRTFEFLHNCFKTVLIKPIRKIVYVKYSRLSRKLGFFIPFNVFGPGLYIPHIGNIIVNKNVRVGKNCVLQPGTCIGMNGKTNNSFIYIGDNVYISNGAKIIGDLKIANNVIIGAGAVVVKDILQAKSTWAGVPAKKISDDGYFGLGK